MSAGETAGKSEARTETLYLCKICGKVGARTMPSPIDFGGCAPPSKAHIFQKIEVVLKQ